MFRTVNKVKCLNDRRCYVLADVIIFVYEVPNIFWHYFNVDEVSLITLKKVLQSAMALLQIATGITKCDDYYKLRQYRHTNSSKRVFHFFSSREFDREAFLCR